MSTNPENIETPRSDSWSFTAEWPDEQTGEQATGLVISLDDARTLERETIQLSRERDELKEQLSVKEETRQILVDWRNKLQKKELSEARAEINLLQEAIALKVNNTKEERERHQQERDQLSQQVEVLKPVMEAIGHEDNGSNWGYMARKALTELSKAKEGEG